MSHRPRLCILTDIGGDPDDTQSLIRLLVYANEFTLEGLLPSASGTIGECPDPSPRPDLIHRLLDAYAEVLPNLRHHAPGWPETDHLRRLVHPGQAARGRDVVGEGHDTAASRWLIERIDAGSPDDPLNLSIWGGQSDLAQALWQVRARRGARGLADFLGRLRVYDIDDQDRLAEWLRREFPGLRYVLSKAPAGADKRLGTYRGMYLGGDESLTSREWIDAHIRAHGPLGALYPVQTWTAPNPHGCLKEGDTPSWFFFLPLGGNQPDDPTQPGWGGQYQRLTDTWFGDRPVTPESDPRESVHRHRPAFQADFARRMAWCTNPAG